MIALWLLIVASSVFGLAGAAALFMLFNAMSRARQTAHDNRLLPMQTFSIHYWMTYSALNQRPNAKSATQVKVAAMANGNNEKPVYFDVLHARFYSPFITIMVMLVFALTMIVLWVGLYWDIGYWTRTDAMVVDFATWIAVTILLPMLVGLLAYLAGTTHSKYEVITKIMIAISIAIGLLLFFSVFVTNDHQFLYWGTAIFLHLILLAIGYHLFTKSALEPNFKWGQRTEGRAFSIISYIQGIFAVIWLYFTAKAIWLVFANSYRNIWDNDTYMALQAFTDIGFAVILMILFYITAYRIEDQKADRARYKNQLPFLDSYPAPYATNQNTSYTHSNYPTFW